MKIYHNPRCKKSRAGLAYLESKNIEFEIVQYLKTGISEDELSEILNKLNKKPLEMIRKQEAIFKQEYKGKELSDQEWIKAMVANPKLIQRPIIVDGEKAVWGDPAENIEFIF